MTTMAEKQISANLNEAVSAGTTSTCVGGGYAASGSPFYLGADYTYFRCIGWRFQIPIPKGATINSATLSLCAYESATNAFDVTIFAQNIGNAAAFPSSDSTDTSTGAPGYRTPTSASDRWYSGTGLTSWAAGSWYAANVVNSLQAMVNHVDWAENNYGVFLMKPTGTSLGDYRRKIYTFYGGSTYGAKLNATYTAAGGVYLLMAHLNTQGMI